MKKLVLIIIGLLFISTVSYAVAEAHVNPDKLHFYMYGAKTCPHCRRMKEEIPRVYGNDSFTYYELVDNTKNQALFGVQYQYTGIAGVPAIGIAYDGKLEAIVEGEFNISAAPKIVEVAIENNGLILVTGGKAYIIKNETIIQKLQVIYVEHRNPDEPVTTTTTTTTPGNSGICGPGILVALAVIPLVLLKRRR